MCSIWLCVEWKTNVGKTWPLPSRSLESSWFIETTLRQRSCIIVRESQLEKKKHLTVEGGWSEKETSEGGWSVQEERNQVPGRLGCCHQCFRGS